VAQNPTTLIFFGLILVVLVLFMFRNGRKRQRDQLALTQGLKPGAEIMTTFGVFGTIESVDETENRIVIRTGPNSELTIHRQAVGRIVTTTTDAAGTELNGEPIVVDDAAAEPEFGERVERGHDAAPADGDAAARGTASGRSAE